jgi:peptide/nickel transport system substrate-binding protein
VRSGIVALVSSIAVFTAVVPNSVALGAEDALTHGIAMHGSPKYRPDFEHFGYVNPAAPKGGRVRFAAIGTFDSVNPFIIKGIPAQGLRGLVYESLMARSYDEPFSLYGLIAEAIEVPPDRSWVAFTLRAQAKFSDGRPVTVDDVIYSWKMLRDKGRPNHRTYYAKVVKIERPGPRIIKFVFGSGADREIPMILGLMPVLPKHFFTKHGFDKTLLAKPVGSGPYVVAKVEAGKSITYKRDPAYWGRHLAVNRGRHNFDIVKYDYFRDNGSAFEAFKKGLIDVRGEGDPTRWATSYKFPAVKQGRVVTEKIPMGLPSGMSAFVFNTRRAVFKDPRIRAAIKLLFDFEWANRNLYYGLYSRTQSFYDNSELSSHGRPADAYERALLKAYRGAVTPAILAGSYRQPVSDGTGRNRANRRKALKLLKSAGFETRNGALVNRTTGRVLGFEIVLVSRDQERLALTFARSLKRAGIAVRVRRVDSAQFQRRLQEYDYDMVPYRWYNSLSPGNEQYFYWGRRGASQPGTRNYMGADNPAIDGMIEALLEAHDRPRFVSAVRALDRVLLSGDYVVPLFHLPHQWIARWTRIRHPARQTLWGIRIDTWWHGKNQK